MCRPLPLGFAMSAVKLFAAVGMSLLLAACAVKDTAFEPTP
jgi:hypothetical protein